MIKKVSIGCGGTRDKLFSPVIYCIHCGARRHWQKQRVKDEELKLKRLSKLLSRATTKVQKAKPKEKNLFLLFCGGAFDITSGRKSKTNNRRTDAKVAIRAPMLKLKGRSGLGINWHFSRKSEGFPGSEGRKELNANLNGS